MVKFSEKPYKLRFIAKKEKNNNKKQRKERRKKLPLSCLLQMQQVSRDPKLLNHFWSSCNLGDSPVSRLPGKELFMPNTQRVLRLRRCLD